MLPTRPSGRPVRSAADELFAVRRREVEQAAEDWRAWYRLGLAYDDAGDRRRARQAIRHAITLHAEVPTPGAAAARRPVRPLRDGTFANWGSEEPDQGSAQRGGDHDDEERRAE